MEGEFISLDLRELSPTQTYDLLVTTIQPRPIAFVSTVSQSGIPNLAPFSFFIAGGSNPPSLAYSPTLGRDGKSKDSLRNVEETGEFVVNTVHREMAEGMNRASFPYDSDSSEWEVSGFTAIASQTVKPPRVAESLVQMECRVHQIVAHGDGVASARYVIGEVLKVHVRTEAWGEGHLNPEKVKLISRLGGAHYLDTERLEFFELPRPIP